MHTRAAAALLSALLVGPIACKTDAGAPNNPSHNVAAPNTASQATHNLGTGPSMGPRTRGVPHSNNIDLVVLSRAGDTALSRDSLGGVRYWPKLDGSSEPMLMPIRGAQQLSLAKASSSTTIAVVDGIGALHILAAQDDGSMKELYMSTPSAPVLQAEVLRGGEKLLVLTADHKIVLMTSQGVALATIEQRRFNPQALVLASDENSVFALSSDSIPTGGKLSATLRPVQIDVKANKLDLSDDEFSIDNMADLNPKRFALSPDGKRFAFLGTPEPKESEKPQEPPMVGSGANRRNPSPQPPAKPHSLMVATLGGDVMAIELNLPLLELGQTALGFLSDTSLVVGSRPSGGTWLVKLGTTVKTLPMQSVVANDTQRAAQAFAVGTHLAADGTWLFVQKPEEGTHHYLGYASFDPQFASISPNGEHVAWSNNAMIYVEGTQEAGKSIRITAPPTEAYFRAAFIDDKHLVAVDYSGGLHLVDWKAGKEVASIDTGGSVRDFEVDQKRKLIRGIRQNGGSWVSEVSGQEFRGPYLVRDNGFRSGFLDAGKALWTIDARNRYHAYSLEQLRAGLSPKDLEADVSELSQDNPVAIDRKGQLYIVKPQHPAADLVIKKLGEKKVKITIKLPWSPLLAQISPDGKHVALVSSNGGIVKVYNTETGKSEWSVSFVQGIRSLAWSKDSAKLAVASQVGAVVYQAATGDEIRLGCGHWFERRATPPPSTASFLAVPNLCER